MPGGFGTWAELMDVTTAAQIGLHDKPVVAVSAGRFYHGIAAQSRTGVEKGLVRVEGASKLTIVDTAEAVMKRLIEG